MIVFTTSEKDITNILLHTTYILEEGVGNGAVWSGTSCDQDGEHERAYF